MSFLVTENGYKSYINRQKYVMSSYLKVSKRLMLRKMNKCLGVVKAQEPICLFPYSTTKLTNLRVLKFRFNLLSSHKRCIPFS